MKARLLHTAIKDATPLLPKSFLLHGVDLRFRSAACSAVCWKREGKTLKKRSDDSFSHPFTLGQLVRRLNMPDFRTHMCRCGRLVLRTRHATPFDALTLWTLGKNFYSTRSRTLQHHASHERQIISVSHGIILLREINSYHHKKKTG